MAPHSTSAFVPSAALAPSSRFLSSQHAVCGAPRGRCGVALSSPRLRRAVTATVSEPTPPPSAPPSTGEAPIETDVLVVGGGVSGCSLAYNLHSKHPGTSVLLTEARDRLGGNVISRNEGGYTWEEGPNTFQPSVEIMRLVAALGLQSELVLADSTLPRFVYWDENLFALPMSPNDIPKFRLLSPWGAIRAGLGAAGLVMPHFGRDESVKQFITRHLGAEVFAKMIDPFVSGVYAGNPANLCMSAAFKKIFTLQGLGGTQGIVEGAIIRLGQKKREAIESAQPGDEDLPKWKGGSLGSFRKGLATLPAAIGERLGDDRVRLGWQLRDITYLADRNLYRATYDTPGGTERTVVAKSVCVSVPARAAASILAPLAQSGTEDSKASDIDALKDIQYPTVWSITLAYPSAEFRKPLKGFGNLIPRSMGIRTLGTIWSSSLFPGRAPEGMELLLSYIGGAQDEGIKELTQEQVVAQVDADIKRILIREGSDVAPVVVGAKRWERAIPQYNVGYWDIMDKLNKTVEPYDGLFVGGNYVNGVAFGDCIAWGEKTADVVSKYVSETFATTNAE